MIQAVPRRGEIVLAIIPFTDLAASKIRPAVIVSDRVVGQDVVLVAISSVVRGATAAHDVVVENGHPEFPQTGLRGASVIRCHHIITVETQMLSRKLGVLSDHWQRQVDEQLKRL